MTKFRFSHVAYFFGLCMMRRSLEGYPIVFVLLVQSRLRLSQTVQFLTEALGEMHTSSRIALSKTSLSAPFSLLHSATTHYVQIYT